MVELGRLGEVRPIEGIPGGFPIPVSGGGNSPNQPTWAQGFKIPAAAGTGEVLQTQTIPDGFTLFVRAYPDNSDAVYIGKSKANSEALITPLEPGAYATLALTDVNEVWVNSLVTGDGVFWYVEAAA